MSHSFTERMLRMLDHVHAHLDDTLSPEILAGVAGLSIHHFHTSVSRPSR